MLSATFYWKEGAPTWVGTAVFSSKKETLKQSELEVCPFLKLTRQSKVEVYTIDPAALLWGRLFLGTHFLYV